MTAVHFFFKFGAAWLVMGMWTELDEERICSAAAKSYSRDYCSVVAFDGSELGRIRLIHMPDYPDIFVERRAIDGPATASEVIGCHEVREMGLYLLMLVVVEALDGCAFDRAVHTLNLAVGPRMVGLCEQVLDTVGLTKPVEAQLLRRRRGGKPAENCPEPDTKSIT